jgi:hypothetical protein
VPGSCAVFDLSPNSFDLYYATRPAANRHEALFRRAIGLFNASRRDGILERARSILFGHAWRLLNLGIIPAGQVRDRHYAGIKCVNISQISGSMGRTGDFDHHFHPMSDRLRDRWVSVAIARCQDIALPAVSVVQVGDRYFVEDGHHRLSVACALGEIVIEAEVTVWDVSGPLPWQYHPARREPRPLLHSTQRNPNRIPHLPGT